MGRSGAVVAALVMSITVSATAVAQLPRPGDRAFERPRERERPLDQQEAPAPPPAVILPPIQREAPQPGGPASRVRIVVREYQITGNTVFTAEELAQVTEPYLNREVTALELEELRRALTLYYVERGYLNSGAVLPDQRISDGIVEFLIVEGELSDIEIQGNEQLRADYVTERLRLGAGPPLNVNDLQERLQLLLQTPFLDQIKAELLPGDRPGEAILRANVEEARPYRLSVEVDNHLAPSQGDFEAVARGTLYNLTGSGDSFYSEVALAEGVHDFYFEYARPLNARDTTLTVSMEQAKSQVIEEPFDQLDIKSDFWAMGVRLGHPIYRTPNEQLWLSAAIDRRHSRSFLLGRGFPFSPGVEADGRSNVTVLRLAGDWVRRTRDQVIAARSTLSLGLNALNATSNETGPTGQFSALLLQFQMARRFASTGIQAVFRADTQLTHHQLLPLEQFAVGGALSVRGYRENQLVRDWGYSGSLELRFPLPVLLGRGDQPTLYLAPFVDVGGGWNNDRPTPEQRNIASTGVGLRWDPNQKVHAELYWGLPLVNVDNPNNSLQDSGIHFLFRANLFD